MRLKKLTFSFLFFLFFLRPETFYRLHQTSFAGKEQDRESFFSRNTECVKGFVRAARFTRRDEHLTSRRHEKRAISRRKDDVIASLSIPWISVFRTLSCLILEFIHAAGNCDLLAGHVRIHQIGELPVKRFQL